MNILKQIAKIILIALILEVFAAYGILQTRWAKDYISAVLEEQIDVKTSKLSGLLPFSPYAEKLELKDNQGVWLEAENVSLNWEADFFPFSIQINHIEAEKINWLRMPESGGGDAAIPGIQINKITFPYVKISKEITGTDIVLALEGRLRINKEELTSTLNISISEISQLYASLQGTLNAEVKLSGSLYAPHAKINATLTDGNKILKLATLLQTKDNLLEFLNIEGGTSGLDITGTLIYNTTTGLADGTLEVNASDLSGIQPFLTNEIKGAGEALVKLDSSHNIQFLEAQGKLQDVIYGRIEITSLILNFKADDINTLSGINADVKIANIRNGATLIENININATGSSKNTNLVIDTNAIGQVPWKLHSQLQLEPDLPDWKLSIKQLQGNIDGNKISITTPAVISKISDKIYTHNLKINIAQGKILADGFYSEQDINLKITPSALPLAALTNKQIEGKIGGTVNLTGTAANPTAAFNLKTTGLAGNLKKDGGFTLNLKGALSANELYANAGFADIKGKSSADLRIPAKFSLSPFNFALPADSPISGKLNISSGIGQLASLFLSNQHRLGGNANGVINLGGTLNTPLFEGDISIKDAQYENFATGTILRNGQIQLKAEQEQLRIIKADALAGRGSVSLSGYISLDKDYPVSIKAAFQKAQIVNMREATGTINGNMQLTGNIASPLITGNLILGPMEINLPEGSEVNISEIKINNPKVLPKQLWQTEWEKTSTPANINLALKVSAPAQVFVRGRGLDTEMRGFVTINGNMANPEIIGDFESVHGTFILLDRELKITEGTLTFRGAIPPSPYLTLIAETTTQDLTAGVRIAGPIRSPELTLTSTPARPEDEIMANLLFGRSLASITPLQGIQLAQAVQKLRGKGGGVDFMGKARNLLGIQRLSVGETESGKFGVEAGRYIGNKIYVGVEGGAEPESGKVKTEIEVNRYISVETETGGRASGVRLNWKKDY